MKLYKVCYYDQKGKERGSLVRSNGLAYALYRFFEKYPELEGRITEVTVALVEMEYID